MLCQDQFSNTPALAAGCSLVSFSISLGPKLVLAVHKVIADWLSVFGQATATNAVRLIKSISP